MVALWPWHRRNARRPMWQDLVDDPPPDDLSDRLRRLAEEQAPLEAPTQMLPTVGLLTPGQAARGARSEDWA